jgi:hypothetical protein
MNFVLTKRFLIAALICRPNGLSQNAATLWRRERHKTALAGREAVKDRSLS